MHHCRLSECQAIKELFRISGSYVGAANLEILVLTISFALNNQAVLSERCELVSGKPKELSFVLRQVRDTRREQRTVSA